MNNVASLNSLGGQSGSNPVKNTRLQVTFLGVGALIIALGILLICYAQNTAMVTLGGIVTTIGTPFIGYGLFMLIYSRCVNNDSSSQTNKSNDKVDKKNKQNPISTIPPLVQSLSDKEKEKIRNAAAKSAEERAKANHNK